MQVNSAHSLAYLYRGGHTEYSREYRRTQEFWELVLKMYQVCRNMNLWHSCRYRGKEGMRERAFLRGGGRETKHYSHILMGIPSMGGEAWCNGKYLTIPIPSSGGVW